LILDFVSLGKKWWQGHQGKNKLGVAQGFSLPVALKGAQYKLNFLSRRSTRSFTPDIAYMCLNPTNRQDENIKRIF
jgi:hypothetical protein